MKVKLDENLPLRLASVLKNLGHEAKTVHEEGLDGLPDTTIWEAAQGEARFLITQDLDFSDLRRFSPGSHHGLLLVRLHSPTRRKRHARIAELFQREEIAEWSGCFVVATQRKLRVLKPHGS